MSVYIVYLVWISWLIQTALSTVVSPNRESHEESTQLSEKQHYDNLTIPLDELRHIFDGPNCSDVRITCKTLLPMEVVDYLRHKVNHGVERLCLFIRHAGGVSFKTITIHLEPLVLLTSLKYLWIRDENFQQGTVRQTETFRIFYPTNLTHALPLQELHINIALRTTGLETFHPFITTLKNLQVLNLGYTLRINIEHALEELIPGLEGKPIVALSLRSFQNIAYNNSIQHFNATQFLWPLRNCPLQYLDLGQNDLLGIFPGIYMVTKQLQILDVSHNNLVADSNKPMWFEFFLHPSIKVLYVNNQGYSNDDYITRDQPMQHKLALGLQTVQDIGSFVQDLAKCKHKLGINDTEMKVKTYFCKLLYCIDRLQLAGIPCQILPSWYDLFPLNFTCTIPIKYPLAKNLREINAENVNILATGTKLITQTTLCIGTNSVRRLTLANNQKLLNSLYFDNYMIYTRVLGLENMVYADFRNNDLHLPLLNEVISSFHSLQFLYLSGNVINVNNSHICQRNRLLKILDLGRNNLETIPSDIFKGCQYLEELDISQNYLSDIYLEVGPTKLLNGSNNHINRLSGQTITTIKNLAATKGPLKLDLSNNPWDCGCSSELDQTIHSLQFLQTAQTYNIYLHGLEHYQCFGLGRYSLVPGVKLEDLLSQCNTSKLWIYIQAITSTISVILVLFIFYLCFKCRYRINTCYFHTCQRLHKNNQGDRKAKKKIIYDAFVSYCADDRFWVHDVLRTELEGNFGLKLCLHYRDFPGGGDLADVIVDKIAQSNSIVVVLSRFSVQRPWCDFELKSAHAQHLHTGKDLIIIKLGEIQHDLEVTELVQDLLNSRVYIQWPDVSLRPSESEKKQQAIFWMKIQNAIYGRDYCECFRYCNPLYNRNDPLKFPLLDDTD